MAPATPFSRLASSFRTRQSLLKSGLRHLLAGGALAMAQLELVSAQERATSPGGLFHRGARTVRRITDPSDTRRILPIRSLESERRSDIRLVAAQNSQEHPPVNPPETTDEDTPLLPATTFAAAGAPSYRPLAPAWADPISQVPNFLGDFVAGGLHGTRTTGTVLTYTGVGVEGGGFNSIAAPVAVNGPGGPFVLANDIPVNDFPTFDLDENPELTGLVQGSFPGATFLDGRGEFVFFTTGGGFDDAAFLYRYLFGSGRIESVALPNPAGGGLVGRIKWIDNNSPLPQDRVYVFYNNVGNFQDLGTPIPINRYTFGAERSWFNGLISTEVRMPVASTASSDQIVEQETVDNQVEPGNLGLLVKAVIYRTPNVIVTSGLGVSLPTADDSRMIVNDVPVLEIRNRTCILQPFLAAAWAPNSRFYAQSALQLDLDPAGNPVHGLGPTGALTQIGTLNDRGYLFLSSNAGYWLYRNPAGLLNGVALQGECHYNRTFGTHDSVRVGAVSVTDSAREVDCVNGTTGLIFRMPRRTDFSLGFSFPMGGPRLYDWNAIAQLSIPLGPN